MDGPSGSRLRRVMQQTSALLRYVIKHAAQCEDTFTTKICDTITCMPVSLQAGKRNLLKHTSQIWNEFKSFGSDLYEVWAPIFSLLAQVCCGAGILGATWVYGYEVVGSIAAIGFLAYFVYSGIFSGMPNQKHGLKKGKQGKKQ